MSVLEPSTTAASQPKCQYCGSLPHPGICPSVKAIEYFPNGIIKRVEMKTPADNWTPPYPSGAVSGNPYPYYQLNPPYRVTWGGSCRHGGEAVLDAADQRREGF